MKRQHAGGPPIQYPEHGGKMKPMTVHLPPDIWEWCREHPGGGGERARDAIVTAYKKAKKPNKNRA